MFNASFLTESTLLFEPRRIVTNVFRVRVVKNRKDCSSNRVMILSVFWLTFCSSLISTTRGFLPPSDRCGGRRVALTKMDAGHLSVHVRGKLVPGTEQSFADATTKNAENSILEPGIARFDVFESQEDFLLIEVYRDDEEAPSAHKETKHYAEWRDEVADSMSIPRSAKKYKTLYPEKRWMSTPAKQSAAKPFPAFCVVVDVAVVEGREEEFVAATIRNCRMSSNEAGILRFDLLESIDDKSNFVLVEVYRDEGESPAKHKETGHYAEWRDTVADMMARPRTAEKYWSIFPSCEEQWRESSSSLPAGLTTSEFSFLSPKLLVGRGVAASAISECLRNLGANKPFVVTGSGGLDRYGEELSNMLPSSSCRVSGEPTVAEAVEAASLAQSEGYDAVVAIGGGSALDLGKAVAALATNLGVEGSTAYTYLESVGEGKPIQKAPLPLIAVPTTAGTGSEATKNAVLKCEKNRQKASMRADSMLPVAAVVDPVLTVTCPPQVTAHVGLDALCQNIEPFVSKMSNPIVDALAREGMTRAARSLRRAVIDGSNLEARDDLAIASLLGGQSLANAKLGAVHGFAGVIGGRFDAAPHGAVCAALLAPVFRANVAKLQREEGHIGKFEEVARILTGDAEATPEDGAAWLDELVSDLKVPGLRALCTSSSEDEDWSEDAIREIIEATASASSTKGNPVELSLEELESILLSAL